MRQAVDKGQYDATPLLFLEQLETMFEGSGFCRGIDLLDHVRLERCVAKPRIVGQNLTPKLAHGIKGAEAHDAGEPRRAGAALGREGGSILPDLDESVQQYIGSDLRPLHNPQRYAVEPARFKLLETLQRNLAAASHGFDQNAD